MTLPVPNMQAAQVRVLNKSGQEIGQGYVIPPWNSFFQQLVQQAPAVVDVNVADTPYTANANGRLIIIGAASITLTRGLVNINVSSSEIIPVSVGDTVSWTGAPTVQFLGA